jgi:hypothetical protein
MRSARIEKCPLEEMMEHWEHLVVTLEADAKKAEEFLRSKWPGGRFSPYAPESLIPQLDDLGRQGWELASAQPVTLGKMEMYVISQVWWLTNLPTPISVS